MSSLGQLSTRLDHRLQVVGELTRALLALRADLTGKLEVLKLEASDVDKARVTIIEFLNGLSSTLKGKIPIHEDHRVILERLVQAGESLADWAEDFDAITTRLQAQAPLDASQLDKIMRVVGHLQGEAAEDVRRLRSR